MKALMVSYLNRNTDLMLQYMLEYGYLTGTPTEDDMEMLRTFITNILDYVEITDIEQFTALMKTAPVSSNPNVTFSNNVFMIVRSFTLLEGLCKSVDPDFVIIDALMPVMLEMAVDPFMLRLKIEDDVRHVLLSFFGSQKNMKHD
jgi:predicted unusual protein kinase regulating ubiquinone biosynthesis (AarF/ABC1/UbiB family)